jgi:hypothetical protein
MLVFSTGMVQIEASRRPQRTGTAHRRRFVTLRERPPCHLRILWRERRRHWSEERKRVLVAAVGPIARLADASCNPLARLQESIAQNLARAKTWRMAPDIPPILPARATLTAEFRITTGSTSPRSAPDRSAPDGGSGPISLACRARSYRPPRTRRRPRLSDMVRDANQLPHLVDQKPDISTI